NPAKNFIVVQHPAAATNLHMSIIDYAGRTVQTFTPNRLSTKSTINLQSLPAGIYTLVFRSGKELLTTKFIITNR
ncbi:MAG: T9SS type A sorting domain-containing protein, partial [Chitinophagaceae bacterium]|nr:T9SS type A sorting domain-containing protein [Chitinophagaceae bacterium]